MTRFGDGFEPYTEPREQNTTPTNGLEPLPAEAVRIEPRDVRRRLPWINIALFFATVFSTLAAGAIQNGLNPFGSISNLLSGIPFSFTLLAILITHEMGHYLTSKWHGVRASLPYFIPAPSFIGTFGAFIRMDSPIMTKTALLDIGASGPIAGFVVAVIASAIGLSMSTIVETDLAVGIHLGSPLIFTILEYFILGPVPDHLDVILHPVAFAGWIGMLVTMLNLIPIGQLDGGHVAFAIFGDRHREISLVMVIGLFLMGIWGWGGWFIWAVLPLIFGLRHPPIYDPGAPLDPYRLRIGWITAGLFVLTFIPVPFS